MSSKHEDQRQRANSKREDVSGSNQLKPSIYAPSSSPRFESSAVATLIPFSLARERQCAAISNKFWSAGSFSGECMTGNRLKPVAESGVFTVELEIVEKERRLRGV